MNDDDTRDVPGLPPSTGASRRSDTHPAARPSEEDLTTTAPAHGTAEGEVPPAPWLSRARAQDAGDGAASFGPESHAPTTYSSIGRYLLIEELGRGGMGIVFRAYDPLLRREVALKALLQGSMARPLERRRFLREAQAIARLKHPGLIPILDSGIENGCPFFTMELIRGNTLRQRLEQPQSFSPQQAAHLIASLARAAHHAHQQGIIHRDIKPANILLESAETPRLGDFGVAWLDERAAPAAEMLTLHEGEGSERQGDHLPGALVGTPAYMAPEQAQRLPQALGPWSDVYSMGAVLFHMLVGTPPPPASDHPSAEEVSVEALLRHQAPHLSHELATICATALRPQLSARYPSAEHLAQELERYLRGEPVLATRPGLFRSLRWQATRHRALLLAVVWSLVLFGVVVGASELWRLHERVREAQHIEYEAQQRLEVLQEQLTPLLTPARYGQVEQLLTTFVQHPTLRGTRAIPQALLWTAETYVQQQAYDRSLPLLIQAYSVAEHPDEQIRALLGLSSAYQRLGREAPLAEVDELLHRRFPHVLPEAEARAHRVAISSHKWDTEALKTESARHPALVNLWQHLGKTTDTGQHLSEAVALKQNAFLPWVPWDQSRSSVRTWQPAPGTPMPPLPGRRLELAPGLKSINTVLTLPPLNGVERLLAQFDTQEAPWNFQLGYFTVRGHQLQLEQRFDLPGTLSATRADLNNDGLEELYLASQRRLLRLRPGPDGKLVMDEPHPATNRAGSQVRAVMAADLDADGRTELVVGLDGWTAYDVRVFRQDPLSDALKLVTWRRMGAVGYLTPYPLANQRQDILVTIHAPLRDRESFPAEAPEGLPAGHYLVRFKDDTLSLEKYFPLPRPGLAAGRPMVGDVTGDGLPDIVGWSWDANATHSARAESVRLQVAVAQPDGGFVGASLPHLMPLELRELDHDTPQELVVIESRSRRLLLLGVGTQSLAEQAQQLLSPPPRGPLPSPDTPPAVARVLDALAFSQGDLGDHVLQSLRLADPPPSQLAKAYFAAAENYLSARVLPTAALYFEEAARLDPGLWMAQERATQLWQEIHEHQRAVNALLLLQRLRPALFQAESPHQTALDLERAWLELPRHELTFGQEPHAAWQFRAPAHLKLDPQLNGLHIWSVPLDRELMVLPFEWNKNLLSLELDAKVLSAEWASSGVLGIRRRDAPEQEPLLIFSMEAQGGAQNMGLELKAAISGRTVASARLPLTSLEGPALNLRLELEAGQRALYLSVNDQRIHHENLLTLPAEQGTYELFWASRSSPWSEGALMETLIKRVVLRGAEPVVVAPPAYQPFNRLALHFLKEEYALALRLADSPQLRGEPRLEGLKTLLQCHLSPTQNCLTHLTAYFSRVPLDGALSDSVVRFQLRQNSATLFPLLLRLRGWEALELMARLWRDPARVHADERSLQLQLAVSLQALDHWNEKPVRLSQCEAYGQLVLMQLRALESLSQPIMAQQVLLGRMHALQGCQSMTGREEERLQVRALMAQLELKLAILYASLGSEQPMLDALKRALLLAPAPEVLAADAAAQPALSRQLSNPKVAALLPDFHYHLPARQLSYLIP